MDLNQSLILILLILFSHVSAEPSIDCDETSEYYTCTFSGFDTTQPDYQFPSIINHFTAKTNEDVRVLIARDQIISEFPMEVFDIFPNLIKIEFIKLSMNGLDENLRNCVNLKYFDLQRNNLTNIPRELLSSCLNLIAIRFGFNSISIVDENTFIGLTKVEMIEFDNNLIETFSEKIFSELSELNNLRLNGNKLKNLPENLLKNNPKITFLPMENNPTLEGVIPEKFFANQVYLNRLWIENNEITDFPNKLFENTTNLGEIYCRDNKITRLKNGVFDKLENLWRLEVWNNLIENIENDAFLGLKNLKDLSLYNNKLKYLNQKIFKHIPNLTYLDVDKNNFIAISYDFQEFFKDMITFKISSDLESIDANIIQCEYKFHEIYGYSCSILDERQSPDYPIIIDDVDQKDDVTFVSSSTTMSKVPVEIFKKFNTIKRVDFSYSQLKDDSFSMLAECGKFCDNVEELILNHNNFSTIPIDFKYFKNYQKLSMTNNQLSAVGDFGTKTGRFIDLSWNKFMMLQNFPNFTEVNLSNNPLSLFSQNLIEHVEILNINDLIGDPQNFTPTLFASAPVLKNLYMSNRKLTSLNGLSFNRILEVLDVSFNEIDEANFSMINGTESLKVLNFSNNFLPQITNQNFGNLKNLEVLDLSNNKIINLDDFSFQHNFKLTELLLDSNFIEILRKDTFVGLENIENLSISNNRLIVIQDSNFEPLFNLQHLNLSRNYLTSLSTEKFGNVSNIKNLDVSENPEFNLVSLNFSNYFPQSSVIHTSGTQCENTDLCQENPTILCKFGYNTESKYECKLIEAKVIGRSTNFTITGSHQGQMSSSDVLSITADPFSNMTFIPAVIFERFPNLRYLNFKNVGIDMLNNFFNCQDLEFVDLSENRLEKINNDLFKACTGIKELILDNNIIVSIRNEAFQNQAILVALNIAYNRIDELYNDIFDNNKKLEVLMINNNKMSEIDEKTFRFLTSLKNFSINGNFLTILPEKLLDKMINLEEFGMHKLNLESELPSEIFLKNLNLKVLLMYQNNIIKIIEKFFEKLEQLEVLNMEDCNINQIHEDSFKNNRKLRILNLNGNNLVKFEEKLIKNLENLEELYLTNCKIITIGSLERLKSLKILKIDNNSIQNLTHNFMKNSKFLTEFHANNNQLLDINENLLKNCSNLEVLNLSSNNISKLTQKSFENLSKLKIFDIKHNQISSIDENLFQNLTNLQEIFMNDNKIGTLYPKMFENLRNLTKLDLTKNSLTSIHNTTFDSLEDFTNFKEIVLAENYISYIQAQSFRRFPKLDVLDLRGNKLETLTSSMFGDFYLQASIIDVSYNLIKTISADFFDKIWPHYFNAVGNHCLKRNYVVPHKNNSGELIEFSGCKAIVLECQIVDRNSCVLENVTITSDQINMAMELKIYDFSPENVTKVEFSYSSISLIPQILFDDLKNLEVLNAVNVKIKNLPFELKNCENLKLLDLSENFEIDLGDQKLRNCQNLEVLSINNAKLTVIDNRALFGLNKLRELNTDDSKFDKILFHIPSSVEILRLSGNYLKIESKTFQYQLNLKQLYVQDYHGQNLENLFLSCVEGLTKLEILDISNRNSLTFPKLPKSLKILKCNSNNILQIDIVIFESLPNLTEIQMENNMIRSIFYSTFKITTNLEIIRLGHNIIDNLVEGAFNELRNLTELFMDNNRIEKISSNLFRDLEALKILTMSKNVIKNIEPDAFLSLKNLEVLDLSGNRLNKLHCDIFVSLQKLKYLNLQDCLIEALPGSFVRLESLQTLNIAGNYIKKLLFLPNFNNLELIDFSRNNIAMINKRFLELRNFTVRGHDNDCVQEIPEINFFECFKNFEELNFCIAENNSKFGLTCQVSNNSNLSVNKTEIKYLYNKNIPLEVEIFTIFEVFHNLVKLDLWNSSVTDINGIKNCKSLKFIDLNKNFIENLNENLFSECENLESLILLRNEISRIDKNAFKNLKSLKFLDLNFNRISNIPVELFTSLTSLKVLKFSRNSLEKLLEPKLFENQLKLYDLYLGFNQLTEISAEIFNNLKSLRYLNVEHNKLTKIDLTKLNSRYFNYLDLSHNNLSQILIDFKKFSNLRTFIAEKNFCVDKNFDNFGDENLKKLENCSIVEYKLKNDEL